MRKIIALSILSASLLFSDTNTLSVSQAISFLNEATVKLIENQAKIQKEMKEIQSKLVELESKKQQNIEKNEAIAPLNIETKTIKEEIKATNLSDLVNDKKVVVTTWYASIRKVPTLNSTSVKKAVAGDVLTVKGENGSFYLLDDGLYIHKTTVDSFNPFKVYVKTNGQIELLTGKEKLTKKVYAGNVFNAVGTHQSGKWYILDDGGFIDKNIVEIEE